MSPGPWSLFRILVRLIAISLAVAAGFTGGLLGAVIAVLAVVSLGRVPRRQLVAELGLGAAVLAVFNPPSAAIAVCLALCVIALLVAPERGLLRLNGMDRFLIGQDYPGVPMNSHIWVELDQPLDRTALQHAVAALHVEVPMLRTFVREALFGVMRFEARRPFGGSLFDWRATPIDEADDLALHKPFDLERSPPFRVAHAPRDDGAVLLVTIHHAAADGEGMMLVLDWLLQRYNEQVEGTPSQPLQLTVEGIRFRDVVRAHGKGLFWMLAMIRKHLRPRGKVGVQNASLHDNPQVAHGVARHALGEVAPDTWAALRERADALGVTRNDLLVTCALVTADRHRLERSWEDRPFRLLMPANLRSRLSLGPGMQNFLGALAAQFAVDEVRSDDLPGIVHERIRGALELEDLVETPVNLGVLSLLLPPWLMRRALIRLDADPESSFFSFLFSHVRHTAIREVAGATVEHLSVRPPIVRRPGFAVAISRHEGGLVVNIEYLHPVVEEASAIAYLDAFLTEVKHCAAQQ